MNDDILTQDPFNPANDFFADLKDYKPEEVKDDSDFKPFKGSYVCRVARLTHNIGVSTTTNVPYDFYSLNLQVTETIDGDKAENRYLTKRYQNNNESLKKLMNSLFTAGITFETSSREAFDLSLTNAIDKSMRIRAYSWIPNKDMAGNPIPEEERVAKQMFVVVKDFKKGMLKPTELPF